MTLNRPTLDDAPYGVLRTFLLMLVVAGGCNSNQGLDDSYGRRTGPAGGAMNGTRVLSHLFEANGNRVKTSKRLGKSVSRADVVVWVPDTHELPTATACRFLEQWLADDNNRVVVYVGRDYDANVDYWRDVLTESEDQQIVDVQKRLAEQTSRRDQVLAGLPPDGTCQWFNLSRQRPGRRIRNLKGPWAEASGVRQVDWTVQVQLQPPESAESDEAADEAFASWTYERLLYAGNTNLVMELRRPSWHGGRVVIVPDGSWLLNYPLVNHDHRRLAGTLVQSCGSGRRVVFLESGDGGPPLTAEKQTHHMLKAFTTPPFRCILLHLTVLGMIYCLAVYPIFGRAQSIRSSDQSDFGRHVRAMGRLLSQCGDVDYAEAAVDQYKEQVKHTTEETPNVQDQQPSSGDPFARPALTANSATSENDNA